MTREEEVTNYMNKLQLTREEAEQLYKDDHSDNVLPEIKEMETRAKKLKRYYETDVTKTRKPVERARKPDKDKQCLVLIVYNALKKMQSGSTFENLEVKNPEREVTFSLKGEEYSFTLTKHRKRKDT